MTDPASPPDAWTEEDVENLLRSVDGTVPLPTYQDEGIWRELRAGEFTGPVVEELCERADATRDDPLPPLPASGFLDYQREDGTFSTKDQWMQRRKRLSLFALAECFDREGRYLDPILDYAWAICEESTWLLPAHLTDAQDHEGLPRSVPAEERGLALFSARAGQLLMEMDYVLGDRLHPALRERIREEVDHRVLEPYRARDDLHWEGVPGVNWNPVCTASTVIAAMHLEPDPRRLAAMIHRGMDSLHSYLDGFDADGCAGEGISYWNFGMSHYAMLAAHLEARSGGRISLLTPSIVNEIAAFPLRVRLSPGRFVAFSDADETAWIEPFLACWLGDRLNLPGVTALGFNQFSDRQSLFDPAKVGTLSEMVRNLAWSRAIDPPDKRPTPARQEYFDGTEWWLARAAPSADDGLVLAAKGGHNGEPHNHNDCGSFVLHARGESLLTDLGRATYDSEYFGEARYERLVTRSLGHSVPFVDGCEQRAGGEYAATVVDRTTSAAHEALSLELAGCYPDEAGLSSLRRHVRLERAGSGRVTVADEVTFSDGVADPHLESVLVSYFPMTADGSTLTVTGAHGQLVVTTSAPESIAVEHLEDAVDPAGQSVATSAPRDVWRARIGVAPDDDPARRSIVLQCALEPLEGE